MSARTFWVMSKASFAVQLSEEIALTLLVKSGRVKMQLVDVNVVSKLLPPMVGAVLSFTFIVWLTVVLFPHKSLTV